MYNGNVEFFWYRRKRINGWKRKVKYDVWVDKYNVNFF